MRTALILLTGFALVVAVTWLVPALSTSALGLLFRVRGGLPLPADIVILAIDDASLQRIGGWPWPRGVMADALDRLTDAHVRAVGLDVVYAEPTGPNEDARLAAAVARNGTVVLPAQLFEAARPGGPGRGVDWLRPMPAFADAAKAVGHAHVSPGVDGKVWSIQLSKADDRGDLLWAFGQQLLAVAEGIPAGDSKPEGGSMRFGPYRLPVRDESREEKLSGVTFIRPNEMFINYVGPAGSFTTDSFADWVGGVVPVQAVANKIVLIGATAPTRGDSQAVPFMHFAAGGREGGQEMPGVEIHANIINTIRGRLMLRTLPDWVALMAAALVILGVSGVATRFHGWRQVLLLGLLLASILALSLLAVSRLLTIPPLVEMLTGYLAVIPLLLNRSLSASRELDLKLAALVQSRQGLLLESATDKKIARHTFALPQSLGRKLHAVDDLTVRLLARMTFISRLLSGMGEGVVVVDLAGRIVFVNEEATRIFGRPAPKLAEASFADLLHAAGHVGPSHCFRHRPAGGGRVRLHTGVAGAGAGARRQRPGRGAHRLRQGRRPDQGAAMRLPDAHHEARACGRAHHRRRAALRP